MAQEGENFADEREVVGAPPNEGGLGSFSILSQDCFDLLLSFLSLYDCLKLARTSLLFLEEINRSDLKRRKRRLRQSFAYSVGRKEEGGGFKLLQPVESNGKQQRQDMFILPSVRDRLETLCGVLPTNREPSRNQQQVVSLVLEIDRPDHEVVPIRAPEDERISEKFWDAFQIQQTSLRSLQLHAQLLSEVIMYMSPTDWSSRVPMLNGDGMMGRRLDLYISDILCAYYLMGHVAAGLVEGGPTDNDWMDQILSESQERFTDPISCYRAWIFIHTTLLRTAPFTSEQQSQLGIHSESSMHSLSLETMNDGLFQTPTPFMCALSPKLLQVFHELRRSLLSPLRTRLNQFGHLGPTFRGRDLVQSQTVFASSFIALVEVFSSMTRSHPRSGSTQFLSKWQAGEDPVFESLLFLHVEAGKTRPLSVEPPVVILEISLPR